MNHDFVLWKRWGFFYASLQEIEHHLNSMEYCYLSIPWLLNKFHKIISEWS